MRNRLLPALPALLLALAPSASAAQTTLQLGWEVVGDSIANDWGASRVAFTLTNRGTKPLPSSGWAIYFNALHSAVPGSVGGGFTIEDVIADLHRLAPAAGFAGLAPGASIRIPYLTGLLLNRSFVPQGPYIVFDDAKDVGVPLNDYVALPFERPPQGAGHDPRVVTPENQFALDSATRAIPASELPPVFPTPVEVTAGAGTLRLTALPSVEAAEALKNEAAFATEYLRPYFGSTRKAGVPPLRLEVGPVAGQTSPEAYTLVVNSVQGIHIVGVSPAGVRLGPRRRSALGQRLSFPRGLCRDPALRRGAAHRGDPRARDAGSCARRDQGHAGEPAVPAQRPGRPLGVCFAPELPRQRDGPGARIDVPLHRARGRRSRGDAPRGGCAAAPHP